MEGTGRTSGTSRSLEERERHREGEGSSLCLGEMTTRQPCEISKQSGHTGYSYRRVVRDVQQGLDVTEQLKFRAGGKCGDKNINKGRVFHYSGDNGTQQLCQKAS